MLAEKRDPDVTLTNAEPLLVRHEHDPPSRIEHDSPMTQLVQHRCVRRESRILRKRKRLHRAHDATLQMCHHRLDRSSRRFPIPHRGAVVPEPGRETRPVVEAAHRLAGGVGGGDG